MIKACLINHWVLCYFFCDDKQVFAFFLEKVSINMFWTIHQQIKSKILVQNICSSLWFNVLFFFSSKNPVNYKNILKRDTILNARARGRYRWHSAVTNRKCPLQRKQQVEVNLFDQSEARISDAAWLRQGDNEPLLDSGHR